MTRLAAPWHVMRFVAPLLALLVANIAAAQPYLADGGFDRPRETFELTRASLASAIDRGQPRLLIGDASGVRLLDLQPGQALDTAPSRWLAQDAVIRDVAAASGWGPDGEAAYAWYVRDPRSGRYEYHWQWGEVRLDLLDAPQALDMALFVGPEGPEAWVAVPGVAGGRLERYGWGVDPPEVMVQSERSVAAPVLARGPTGERHVAYLEGATIDTPIGTSAEWSAVYRAPDGSERRFEGALAPPARLLLDPGEPSLLVWPRQDAHLMVSDLGASEPARVLGEGRAVGVAGSRAFRAVGASIVASGLPERGATTGDHTNVAWSPYAIDRAALVAAGGITYLAWSGSLAGGGSRAVSSDDATSLQPTWRDHTAARFGWNPWAFEEELVGQATGSLLVGVLGTMVLVPLLWLLTLPLTQRVPERWLRFAGALTATATLALLGAFAAARAAGLGNDATPLLGGWGGFLFALIAGTVVPPLLLRRADLEPQPALLASAGLACFVCLSLIAFLAFQPWLAVLGM